MCPMVDMNNVLSGEVFSLIRIHMVSTNKFSLVAHAETLGNFLICINARWPRLDMQIFIILEPLVLTSSVIPRLRVVLSM